MAIVLIGIDDTDNQTSPGTGQLARRLAAEIEQRGAKLLGVTRHQFLMDDRIAYTSHNSGACLAVEWSGPPGELEFAIGLIAEWSADGSDPGICIAGLGEVPSDVMNWGWAATREVLTRDRAVTLAKALGLCLRPLGGNGEGIIGALASIGLRADGNEGRFLDLPGLRMLAEFVDLQELTQIGIQVDHRVPNGVKIARDGAKYKTLNWVRPRLVGGRPVWPVEKMNTPGSLSIEKNRGRWSRAVSDSYLSIIAIGILAGIVTAFARTPIHLPGHKAILWMAPILATRLVTHSRAGASLGAFSTATTALSLGGRIAGGIAMMPLVIMAGVVLDRAIQIGERRHFAHWQQILFLASAGAVGNLICFVKRLFDPIGAFFSVGNFNDMLTAAGSHAFFGFLAGLVGATAGYALLRFRPCHHL